MEAAWPRRQRRRRGTVDSPLDARLVRVAALVVVPAMLALLFSISPTGKLPRSALEPLFDAPSASELAARLSTQYPARVPGTVKAQEAARWYAETISSLGLATDEDVWNADVPDLGRVELRNEITVVPGRSEEAIVLVAHRDNAGTDQPLGDNASGTAALIELARGFAPQEAAPDPRPQRTLVLVSTDAGAYGGAGAERFADSSRYAKEAIAVIVLDGLGGRGRPRIAVAGDRPRSPARTLVSTAAARIEEQVGVAPELPSVLTQLVDLGIPFAAGEQGRFLARGIAAIAVTTAERDDPAVPAGDRATPLATGRLGQLGRATETLVSSLDISVGAAYRTPDSLFLEDRAASGWTVRLLLIAAVAPFAIGVLDLLVRSRRRQLPMLPGLRGLRTRLLFWLYGGILLWVAAVTGVLPTGAALPLPPYASVLVDVPVAALLLLSIALALGWLIGRRQLVASSPATTEERLAGYVAALTWLGVVAIVLAIVKPYALIFVLPSLYAWIWLPLRTRLVWSAFVYLLGLLGPVVGLVVLARELGLGVLDAPLYLAGLAAVGYVSLGSVLVVVTWGAAAAQLASLAFGRYAPYAGGVEPPPPAVIRRGIARLARASRRQSHARGR